MFPSTSVVLSNLYSAGLIALVLSEAAHIAEIHRGGPAGGVSRQRSRQGAGRGLMRRAAVDCESRRRCVGCALHTSANEYITYRQAHSLVSVFLLEILLVGQQPTPRTSWYGDHAGRGVLIRAHVTVFSWLLRVLRIT